MSAERPWTNKIKKASYKGAEFEVNSVTTTIGNRVTHHNFPFSKDPFAENVGPEGMVISIDGYVDGDNYLQRKEDLIEKIRGSFSPGTLVLPTAKSITVIAGTCTTTFDNGRGGIETFIMQFFEAGKNQSPSVTVDTSQTAKIRAENLDDVTKLEASANINYENTLIDSTELTNDPDSLSSLSKKIQDEFSSIVIDKIQNGLPSGEKLDQFTRTFSNYQKNLSTLILTPTDYMDETSGLYSDLKNLWGESELKNAYDSMTDVFNAAVDDIESVISINDPSRKQQDKNNQAIRDANRNFLLRQLADTTIDQSFNSSSEVAERRVALLELFEQQIENAAIAQDIGQRDSLVDLRSAVVADLDSKLVGLPDELEITLPISIPSFVLANDLYGDGLRGEKIADENKVVNPLFMPVDDIIRVLSA